jgi:hypothetical protein
MLSGKTAESSAFKKASQMGIRIVLHTALEDLIAKITGTEKVTFRKIAQKAVADAEAAKSQNSGLQS